GRVVSVSLARLEIQHQHDAQRKRKRKEAMLDLVLCVTRYQSALSLLSRSLSVVLFQNILPVKRFVVRKMNKHSSSWRAPLLAVLCKSSSDHVLRRKGLLAERCRRQFLGGSRYAAAPPTAHLWMVTGVSRGQGEIKSDRATGRREGEGHTSRPLISHVANAFLIRATVYDDVMRKVYLIIWMLSMMGVLLLEYLSTVRGGGG
ncbi:unnamed protein product, partial [Ectocarpus sp. 8 AP-2014]